MSVHPRLPDTDSTTELSETVCEQVHTTRLTHDNAQLLISKG